MDKRYHSFREIGRFFGVKPAKNKNKSEKPLKCSYCGGEMHRIQGTNVWACGNPFIVDEELDGKPIQVFGSCCEYTEISGD